MNDLFEKDLFDSADDSPQRLANQMPKTKKGAESVTCLGIEFASENERREYFRQQLREKLPELRKWEGFPIGDDENIINLSDPPYYTACPNPWLNDFIMEWETAKVSLESKKKRRSVHDVRQPYASDVSEGKNNPIYNAHSYHTKVPHPAIMRYILHYTQPGDIILDGFAGTGMTGVAAQLCGHPDPETKHKIEADFSANGLNSPAWGDRRAICGDLSPIASFIAHNYNTPIDVHDFERDAKRVLADVESELGWMYETEHVDPKTGNPTGLKGKVNYTVWSDVFTCSHCNGEIVFFDVAMDRETGNVRKEFRCPHCEMTLEKTALNRALTTVFDETLGTTIRQTKSVPVLIDYTWSGNKHSKVPDSFDQEIWKKIHSVEATYEFPKELMMGIGEKWGDSWRAGSHLGITHVHHFYNKRALLLLSALYDRSKRFLSEGKAYIEFFVEQAVLGLAKISRYVPNHFSQVNRYLSGTLYVGSLVVDVAPHYIYSGKLRRLPKAFAMIKSRQVVSTQSAHDYAGLADDSIDYIFTDPPFGANLMYSELNFLWESWLGVKTNNRMEAIENRTQGKSLFDYQEIMLQCFREYHRVLKPGRWMTVEFSNTSAAVWNSIQTGLQRAGFVIANVAALDKKQGSFKAVTTPTAVKQDLVISCYKPSSAFDKRFQVHSQDIAVWDFVVEHLAHLPMHVMKDKKSTAVVERSPKILYDRLISYYLMRGLPVPIDAAEFQLQLRRRFRDVDGMIFTADELPQYEALRKKHGNPSQLSLAFDVIYSENEGVEWLRERLALEPKKPQDLNADFRKANAATRKGEKEIELKTLLEENFIEMPDGRWRVPDPNEAKDRETLRTKALLREFTQYLTNLELAKPKKLVNVRLEALRAGFGELYEKKRFDVLVKMAEFIPQNLLMEDELLLTYFDIAQDKV